MVRYCTTPAMIHSRVYIVIRMEGKRGSGDVIGGSLSSCGGKTISRDRGCGTARRLPAIDPCRGLSHLPQSLVVSPSNQFPAIMTSMASVASESGLPVDPSLNSISSLQGGAPDILCNKMRSVSLMAVKKESFKLIDEKEDILVKNEAELLQKMGCKHQEDLQVKVVSIFGNTGEGKSHALNHIFFNGKEIFRTSPSQTSCTIGVWGAYDEKSKALILDTEGMLGVSDNPHRRKRLLLKVLAISDIVIYRTRSPRLQTDMYKFLHEASRAYTKYFKDDLAAVSQRANYDDNFGPVAIIFHDTKNTSVLTNDASDRTPEEQLRENFSKLKLKIDGFRGLQYVGMQSGMDDTDFSTIREKVTEELDNRRVRSPRKPGVVLDMIKTINKKFSGDIQSNESAFPDEYFTCPCICTSCSARCCLHMNHAEHESSVKVHKAETKCKYQHQFDNKIYLCRKCDIGGRRSVVVPKTSGAKDNTWLGLAKYAWAGYVLECDTCGIIYRSRQYWYGNDEPDKTAVCVEVEHVWPGSIVGGSAHAGRQVLEGVAALGSAISTISAPPTRAISSWLTDQVNPSYWKANHLCRECSKCSELLVTIHHCRKCGDGFCDACSTHTMPVPERGWGQEHVRVCDTCYELREGQNNAPSDPLWEPNSHQETDYNQWMEPQVFQKGRHSLADEREIRVRQVSEAISGTLATVAKYPIDLLKHTARPTYWVPDEEIEHCAVCKSPFGPRLVLHHCRACGEGVCHPCSQNLHPVKERGWDHPVRVCDNCYKT
ncbi:zinc finger FYVE domain-containing protein 1-like isoform X2 [Oratosquilla oratoria]|uniref:zinc finger FYVE domain-containing protein 1-like isoform X2 n=1 Tax=Oratosquilla oratoria TaxID=337810 RepID=UPI003F76D14C